MLGNDLLKAAFVDFACDGVEEFVMNETEVDELLGERAYSGGKVPTTVMDEVNTQDRYESGQSYKFFFYRDDFKTKSKQFLDYLNQACGSEKFSIEQKKWEDWNTTWRKDYGPIKVADNLTVVPEWMKNGDKNDEIYIYPGQGFGTGEHATTYLCLLEFTELLDKLKKNKGNKACLDLGCGSGILGIAAMKLSNMQVDFVDVDKDALDNTLQNLTLNFADQDLSGNSLIARERFRIRDNGYALVFANILENVIIDEKNIILDSLALGGYLIISGILVNQIENIKETFSCLDFLESRVSGDWASISFYKQAMV